jgi:uracil-DNA glycosylase family 4
MQGEHEHMAHALVDLAMLEWYLDAGVNELYMDAPVDRMAMPSLSSFASDLHSATSSVSVTSMASAAPKAAAGTSVPPSATAMRVREAMDKAESLDAVRQVMLELEGCALKRTAEHTIVGEGSDQPKVLFISDTPRDAEDRQGIAFAGDAQVMLRRACQGLGLAWEDAYRMACVCWRPPGNRGVTPEELAICLPFVEKTIALLRPQRIVLMGATPIKMLLKLDGAVSRIRGTEHHYGNGYLGADTIETMLTYHPYTIAADGVKKKQFWTDLVKVSAQL